MRRALVAVVVFVLLSLLSGVPAWGQGTPRRRTDLHGDPLPEGAVARLGTRRFRSPIGSFLFSADDRFLALPGMGGVRLCDGRTGRELHLLPQTFTLFLPEPFAFAPDGRLLCTHILDMPQRLHFWDTATGKERWHIKAGKNKSLNGCFLSGGQRFLSWGEGDLRVWEAATGKLLRRMPLPDKARRETLAVSPRGRLAAAVAGHILHLLDLATGKERRRLSLPATVDWMHFSPDERILATVADECKTLHLWNVVTGREVRISSKGIFYPYLLPFTPDSRILFTLSTEGLCGREKSSGKRLWTAELGEPPDELAVSPDGRILAHRHEDGFALHDARTGKLLRKLPTCSRLPYSVRMHLHFSADSKTLVADDGQALRFCSVDAGAERPRLVGHTAGITRACFSANGHVLATTDRDGTICAWEAKTGKRLQRWRFLGAHFEPIALSADGQTLAGFRCESEVRGWNVSTGRERFRFAQHQDGQRGTGGYPWIPCSLHFTPDPRRGARALSLLATETAMPDRRGRDIDFRDALTGAVSFHVPQEGNIQAFALSPNGRRLAVFGQDSEHDRKARIDLWDLGGKPRLVATFPGPLLSRLQKQSPVFSPDGKLLATVAWNEVLVWEVASRTEVLHFQPAGQPTAVTLLADGRILVLATTDESVIDLWDGMTGKRLKRLHCSESEINDAVFSPDGSWMVTAFEDTTALVWDVQRLAPDHRKTVCLSKRELDRLWALLAEKDGARAFRAEQTLRAAPASVLPFLRKHLKPIPEQDHRQLIADLDSNTFTIREKARKELAALGLKAEPALRALVAAKPSLEARRRAERLLAQLYATPSPEVLRRSRAVQVLEQMATPDARALLQTLARGAPGAGLTEDAKAALQRLDRKP